MALKKTRAKPKTQTALSKPQEVALMRVYNAYWDGYIKGDVKAIARLLDEQYTQVGSAESEVFFDKKDAVKFLHDTIDQVAGKAEMRNRVIRVEPSKEFILITELTDLYVLIEGAWVFHSKFRASSLMRKQQDGWKFYHQHSSFPDIRAGEGENMSIEKVALENLQLRDAVKRRTVDLEQKTRDLNVEATLERVRARAMAMHNSSELAETSAVLFHQINDLGINAIRTGVGIFDDPNNAMELWLTTVSESQEVVRILDYVNLRIHPVFENIIPARKENKPYALTVLKGNEVKQYYNTMSTYLSLPKQQTYNPEEFFYSFFFSQGAINVIAPQVLTEEECSIMIRVAQVFGVIYTRFLDLKKAEEQTREAQIELALERVRAKTMAMHKSDELVETSVVLFQELQALGVSAIRTGVAVFNKEKETMELWSSQLMEQKQNPVLGIVPIKLHPFFDNLFEAWKRNDSDFTFALSGSEVKEYYQATSSILSYPPQNEYNSVEIFNPFFFAEGSLTVVSHDPLTDEERNIMRRFASVFGLLYRRFLDLQKAEAQAREAQIETLLERIRAQSMAMHTSTDLTKVPATIFKEVATLGLTLRRCVIWICHPEDKSFTWISANPETDTDSESYHIPDLDHPVFQRFWNFWRDRERRALFEISGDEKKSWDEALLTRTELTRLPDQVKESMLRTKKVYMCTSFWDFGFLMLSSSDPFDKENVIIAERIGRVFEQSYTRYKDILRAEAQAREARIEASLERVRSSMMAMHQSDGLPKVMKIVADQLLHLGVPLDNVLFLPSQNGDDLAFWSGIPEKTYPLRVDVPYTENPLMTGLKEAMREGREFLTIALSKDETLHWWQHLFDRSNIGPLITEERKQYILGGAGITCSLACRKNSTLVVVNYNAGKFSEEVNAILMRFANVFEQAYTRFLDIQKAEAQAREATIEACLEKVRSSALAMKEPVDMLTVCRIISDQLHLLDVKDIRNVQTIIIYEEKFEYINYQYFAPYDQTSVEQIDYRGHPVELELAEKMLTSKEAFYEKTFEGKELEVWREHRKKTNQLPDPKLDEVAAAYYYFFSIGPGGLGVTAYSPLMEADLNTFKRFRNVFELAYRRYVDIEQAQAQAREARIEASLERVRAKAMAMHSSKDLTDSIQLFYHELLALGLQPRRVGVALTDRDSKMARLTTMSTTEQGLTSIVDGDLKMEGHWLLDDAFTHWLNQEEFHAVLKGTEINDYYKIVRPQISYPDYSHDMSQYGYYFMFPAGNVVAWTEVELEEEELKIFRRFTSVISLTYKRHKDLIDAEERTQLAVREASLDRVRAEIASMRHADDLQRITPLVWRELKTLGVPFFRCGVLIVSDQSQKVDYYLSTPEGQPLAALHLDFNTNLRVVREALDHWRQQKVYIDHWNKEQFIAFARSMMELGQIQTMKSYQGGDQAPDEITLQFVPFLQGMLYVGSKEALLTEQIDLMKALADAFSTAYARYEDFTRLETAKVQVENTLKDLRTTQTQLVQSEKMASLGELTAGIAHEIQNPLNFVNNFSEVSKELLDEMEEELKKGNADDAKQIARNVIENLEKINFHGKRADGIVKSMLQHSRKSTGQKELTDINALCDEYLRLSYHGLRAKDKSFSAKFEADLDPAVGQILVMPQEIGRVVLNLINNAFYAVSEKKKMNLNGYEATVTVATKKVGSQIEIRVRDNGTGIPQKALDKIFQPFFTTKPTGQGTGLGLSLSYDIVKAHGGELRVSTTDGAGSEFVIALPS